MSIINPKPNVENIVNVKPVLSVVVPKPSNKDIPTFVNRLYASTINVGEPMGLLLALTYPTTLSFNTPFHP